MWKGLIFKVKKIFRFKIFKYWDKDYERFLVFCNSNVMLCRCNPPIILIHRRPGRSCISQTTDLSILTTDNASINTHQVLLQMRPFTSLSTKRKKKKEEHTHKNEICTNWFKTTTKSYMVSPSQWLSWNTIPKYTFTQRYMCPGTGFFLMTSFIHCWSLHPNLVPWNRASALNLVDAKTCILWFQVLFPVLKFGSTKHQLLDSNYAVKSKKKGVKEQTKMRLFFKVHEKIGPKTNKETSDSQVSNKAKTRTTRELKEWRKGILAISVCMPLSNLTFLWQTNLRMQRQVNR